MTLVYMTSQGRLPAEYNGVSPVPTCFPISGVMGQPRTCLHALLNMLQQGVDSASGPRCLHDTPRLAELAYHLVYMLCMARDTSAPTLRYLRSTYDFLFQQLQHLPYEQANYSEYDHSHDADSYSMTIVMMLTATV